MAERWRHCARSQGTGSIAERQQNQEVPCSPAGSGTVPALMRLWRPNMNPGDRTPQHPLAPQAEAPQRIQGGASPSHGTAALGGHPCPPQSTVATTRDNPPCPAGRFALVQLGCHASRADAQQIARNLAAAGLVRANGQEDADVVVIMTCGFTHQKQLESVREIESALSLSARPRVVVGGCLPDINGDLLGKIEGIRIARPRDLDQPDGPHHPRSIFKVLASGEQLRPEEGPVGIHRIRVCRGCMGECSYCAIPRAAGRLSSRSTGAVRADLMRAVAVGHRNIMLAGEDVGAYGRDRGTSLGALLTNLLTVEGEFNITVESVNPQWLGLLLRDYSALLADRRLNNRWYVPLQAASDTLLRLMRRPYTIDGALQALRRLRSLQRDAHIITDFIVGHPGETLQDVLSAIALLERVKIDYVEIMKFDEHEGTLAARLPDRVQDSEKNDRASLLLLTFVLSLMRQSVPLVPPGPSFAVDPLSTLPVNTNLTRDELRTHMLAALTQGSSSTQGGRRASESDGSATAALASTIQQFCGGDRAQAAQLVQRICARIGPPQAVALGFLPAA